MTSQIASILKGLIENLDFVDKIAGLVYVAEVRQQITDEQTEVKRFPIACDFVDDVECADPSSRYSELIPNDSFKSVLYFEDLGTRETGRRGKDYVYQTTVRLVGWLNGSKLGNTSCSKSPEAIKEIIKTLPKNNFNSGDFTRIKIRVSQQLPKSKDIFSKYTYNDALQYLVYPYDFFALDVVVTYHVNQDCLVPMIVNVEDLCDDK